MRLKSNVMSVVYAGRDLLGVGGYIEADSYGWSENYTTVAEDLLNAEAPELVTNKNARGEMQLPVCIDFDTETAAYAYSMAARNHALANQTGELSVAVGECLTTWQAGISSVAADFRYVGAGNLSRVRLRLTYSFILGKQN